MSTERCDGEESGSMKLRELVLDGEELLRFSASLTATCRVEDEVRTLKADIRYRAS